MARPVAAPVRGTAESFAFFLGLVGNVRPQPTPSRPPTPKGGGGRQAVGQLGARKSSPYLFGFMPCPLTRYTAAVFTAISPEVVRARLPVMSCVVPVSRGASFPACKCAGRSLDISRPSRLSPLFGADGWPQNQPQSGRYLALDSFNI